jgi:hypothetical protein
MNEFDAKGIFDNQIALSKVLGGNLKQTCLEKGVPELLFNKLFKEYQRMSAFIDKHDSDGNIKPGSAHDDA